MSATIENTIKHRTVFMRDSAIDTLANVSGNVSIGRGVVISPYCNIYAGMIGDDTKIGAFTEIGGASIGSRCKIEAHCFLPPGVVIGDEVFVGPGVVFTNDKYPKATGEWTMLRTVVDDGASIGAHATIIAGVHIGKGARVGAGSVVTHDVPPGETYVGVPARLLSDDII